MLFDNFNNTMRDYDTPSIVELMHAHEPRISELCRDRNVVVRAVRALHHAASDGRLDIILNLESIKPLQSALLSYNINTINLAAAAGHLHIIQHYFPVEKKLCQFKLIDAFDALISSAYSKKVDIATYLLSFPEIQENLHEKIITALRAGVESENIEFIRLLLSYSSISAFHIEDIITALYINNDLVKNRLVISELYRTPEIKNAYHVALFREAAKQGNVELVLNLLQQPEVLAQAEKQNNRALLLAISFNRTKIVKHLLTLESIANSIDESECNSITSDLKAHMVSLDFKMDIFFELIKLPQMQNYFINNEDEFISFFTDLINLAGQKNPPIDFIHDEHGALKETIRCTIPTLSEIYIFRTMSTIASKLDCDLESILSTDEQVILSFYINEQSALFQILLPHADSETTLATTPPPLILSTRKRDSSETPLEGSSDANCSLNNDQNSYKEKTKYFRYE